MTEEQQRHAIAEMLGITPAQKLENGKWFGRDSNGAWVEVPDYLTDLNAMHEAEKALTENQNGKYMLALDKIAGTFMAHRATAAQRAEAFLKTIGKWQETSTPQTTPPTPTPHEC